MLTYALVDRGTVAITGLEQQTNDKAKFEGQYYSDKLPGFSVAGDCSVRDRQGGPATAEPSAQRCRVSLLGRRLLGHTGHFRTLHCLYGCAPRGLGRASWAAHPDGVS